jgi:hypothetical protein
MAKLQTINLRKKTKLLKDNIMINEHKKGVKAMKYTAKPRNFVAKNMTTSGAGAHKDKKKAAKQGEVKHKAQKHEYSEHLENLLKNKLEENPTYIEHISEAPIEMDPAEPMNPTVYGHQGVNPAKLKTRMLRAAGQLKDLADRAQTDSALGWESIARNFDELAMNIEQIRHGIDELAKVRKKGGINSRGIDKHIGEGTDSEGAMARTQLITAAKLAINLATRMDSDTQLDSWVQSKIAVASDYIETVFDFLEHGEQDVDK